MTKISRAVAAALTIGFTAFAPGAAQAVTMNYSFSNVVGNVAGTVTGHVDGLIDNATTAATAVFVDSYPAGLVQFGSYPTPFDVFGWTGGTLAENSFTMSGGVVTAAFFSLFGANGINDQLYLNSACNCQFGTGHTNFLDIGSNDSRYVWSVGNLGATDGLVFSNPIPEPETYAMLLAGLGLLGFAARRRKQQEAAA